MWTERRRVTAGSEAAAFILALGALLVPPPARAQDLHILWPADTVERRLVAAPLKVLHLTGSRWEKDRTQRVVLAFPDSSVMQVKWAKAPRRGGGVFNNEPRYEVAAYELQKLFLTEDEYVVPPTALRAFPLEWYRTLEPGAPPTFEGASSVLVALQYWLSGVTIRDVYDRDRLRADSVYARHLGNLNVLTHLIRHKDSNLGNFLISEDSTTPRIFSVDNGVAFDSEESDRGTEWQRIRVDRLPHGTVERLRGIRLEDLRRSLGVLAQFEIREGQLARVEPGENLDERRGIRRAARVIQLGLSAREIRGIHGRLRKLLERVDRGRIELLGAVADPLARGSAAAPGLPSPSTATGPAQAERRLYGEYGLWVSELRDTIEARWITAEPGPGTLKVIVAGTARGEFTTPAGRAHAVRFRRPRSKTVVLRYGGLESPEDAHETTLHFDLPTRPRAPVFDLADSTFVVGDVHGQYERLVRLLRNARVIDDELRWSAGRADLVLLGDLVDRGPDATRVLWLVYRLEREAKAAGGRVHVVLGNHEIMVMTGDLRYLSEKEAQVARWHGVEYWRMLDPRTSVLGRWLVTKPAILRLGDVLFAHGGVSADYLEYDAKAYHDSLWAFTREPLFHRWADSSVAVRIDSASLERRIDFFFGPSSVFWYRDYVTADTLADALARVLRRFESRRHVVAHTPVDRIQERYGGALVVTHPAEAATELLLLVRSKEGILPYRWGLDGPPRPISATDRPRPEGRP